MYRWHNAMRWRNGIFPALFQRKTDGRWRERILSMQKKKIKLLSIIIIIAFAVLLVGGVSYGRYYTSQKEEAEKIEKEKEAQEDKENAKAAEKNADQDDIEEPATTEKEQTVEEPADTDFVKITDYIPDIVVDLKYATADNFTGTVIYDFKDAYLRYGTVKKLAVAQEKFKSMGYYIKIWDAYRPFAAQEKLWQVCPNPRYVANPANGMKAHNLGGTIDMTLVTFAGNEVEMPTAFDDFSLKADRDYSDVSETAEENARMMESVMAESGFRGYAGEWWDYSDTTAYEAYDFEP